MQVRSYIPEYKRKRDKQRIYFVAGVAIVILYFLSFGVLWFLFRSPIFRVNHIEVKGNTTVTSDSVVSLVEAAMRPSIIGFKSMMAWPSRIPSSTLSWVPQLATLSVSKNYFSQTITINVKERTSFGIWCFMPNGRGDEQCFWFDETGTMFERTFDTEGSVIMVIHDYSQKATGVNRPVLGDAFRNNFISIIKVLRADHVPTKNISLNDLSLQEITVTTMNGPTLYFSLRFPADNYGQVIAGIMAQPTWGKLSYIDCRTENRVYYK